MGTLKSDLDMPMWEISTPLNCATKHELTDDQKHSNDQEKGKKKIISKAIFKGIRTFKNK